MGQAALRHAGIERSPGRCEARIGSWRAQGGRGDAGKAEKVLLLGLDFKGCARLDRGLRLLAEERRASKAGRRAFGLETGAAWRQDHFRFHEAARVTVRKQVPAGHCGRGKQRNCAGGSADERDGGSCESDHESSVSERKIAEGVAIGQRQGVHFGCDEGACKAAGGQVQAQQPVPPADEHARGAVQQDDCNTLVTDGGTAGSERLG